MPKFVLKEMESLYIEELKSSINLLMANLESLPVSKGGADSKYGLHKIKRYNHRSVFIKINIVLLSLSNNKYMLNLLNGSQNKYELYLFSFNLCYIYDESYIIIYPVFYIFLFSKFRL